MRLFIVLLALLPGLLAAEIYKWVDENGNVHYGDKPPQQPAETLDIETPAPSSEAPPMDSKRQIEEALRIVTESRERREDLEREEAAAIAERERIQQECEKLLAHKTLLKGGGFIYRQDDPGKHALSDEELAAEIAKLQRSWDENCAQFQ